MTRLESIIRWLLSLFAPKPEGKEAEIGVDRMLPIDRSRAITMLSNEEGRRNRPYKDSKGYWTIGVGHLMDPRKGGSLPEWAQYELDSAGFLSNLSIDRLLEDDLSKAINDLEKYLPWALELDPVRFGVLLDMCFQMGIGSQAKGTGLLGFKNTLAMVRARDFVGASQGMKHSLWYRQTPNRANRRRGEMLTGKFHDYA